MTVYSKDHPGGIKILPSKLEHYKSIGYTIKPARPTTQKKQKQKQEPK